MDPAKADPWNAAYDDEFARSGITHQLMGVLAPERFADEAMPDDRKRELLGQRYAASVQAGARNAPTVEGRFGTSLLRMADAADGERAVRRHPGQ